MKRIFWFVTAPAYYAGIAAALTAILFAAGCILGILAGAFGSGVFNWVTAISAYIGGLFVHKKNDPLPYIATTLLGGYIAGQIIRVLFSLF